jgi:hypothetical protein
MGLTVATALVTVVLMACVVPLTGPLGAAVVSAGGLAVLHLVLLVAARQVQGVWTCPGPGAFPRARGVR